MIGIGRSNQFTVGSFIIAFVFLCLGIFGVLWWTYSMGAQIAGGFRTLATAEIRTLELSSTLSCLIAPVWVFERMRRAQKSLWMLSWTACWQTAVVLLLYAGAIVVRRQSWQPSKGFDDWVMFFGRFNAEFFAEAGPLSFVLMVIPLVSVISAILVYMQEMIASRATRDD